MKKRRIAVAISVFAMIAVLSGCVDVFQYVSGTANTLDVFLRVTLQKSAFELAASFDEEPQDLDQMFREEFALDQDEVVGELPSGLDAEFRQVQNEFEFGFELEYQLPRAQSQTLSDGDAPFVPRVTQRSITIPLAEASEGSDGQGEGDEFAAAFFGSSKYRLAISKRLISRVSSARLHSSGEVIELEVFDLPDIWMIEFPISYWLMASTPPSVEIIF